MLEKVVVWITILVGLKELGVFEFLHTLIEYLSMLH